MMVVYSERHHLAKGGLRLLLGVVVVVGVGRGVTVLSYSTM